MRHTSYSWLIGVSALAGGWSLPAAAIDATRIAERFTLVGVIAEGNAGVAVLRDLDSNRTFTLRTGQTVPSEPGLTLSSVGRRGVMLAGQNEAGVEVGYRQEAPEPTPESSSADGILNVSTEEDWRTLEETLEAYARGEVEVLDFSRSRIRDGEEYRSDEEPTLAEREEENERFETLKAGRLSLLREVEAAQRIAAPLTEPITNLEAPPLEMPPVVVTPLTNAPVEITVSPH